MKYSFTLFAGLLISAFVSAQSPFFPQHTSAEDDTLRKDYCTYYSSLLNSVVNNPMAEWKLVKEKMSTSESKAYSYTDFGLLDTIFCECASAEAFHGACDYFIYDSRHLLIKKQSYIQDGNISREHHYRYNQQNKMISDSVWSFSTLEEYWTYGYDNWERLTEIKYHGPPWRHDYITNNSYFPNHLLKLSVTCYFDEGDTLHIQREEFSYNNDGLLLEKMIRGFSDGSWENETKYIYTYNIWNKIEKITQSTWTHGAWSTSDYLDCTYNEVGQLVDSTRSRLYRYEFTYNENGLRNWINGIQYCIFTGQWVPIYEDSLYWQKFEIPNFIDEANNIEFTFYPSPASSAISFELTSVGEGKNYLSVIDLTGRELLRKETLMPGKYSLDVHQWSPGMYFLSVFSEDKKRSEKFVVSR